MAPRAPTTSDFPPHINLIIDPPPHSKPPTNILLLLHGLGDTQHRFSKLARDMSLPETLCISIRGPTPLPFDLGAGSGADTGATAKGWHWGDDIVFDPNNAESGVDVEGCGYTKATSMIWNEIVQDVLVDKRGYSSRDVHVLGWGQGGGVGLSVASVAQRDGKGELGGVLSLGGALPEETRRKSGELKCKTPVLVCHGSKRSAITVDRAKELKERFDACEFARWQREGDGMATNREEMLPIMRFYGRRLRSRAGVPEGAVEVG